MVREPWSPKEISALLRYYPEKNWEKLRELIPGRSDNAIKQMARKMEI